MATLVSLLLVLRDACRSCAVLQLDTDRVPWIWLARVWRGWRDAIVIVRPATVIDWHRRGWRLVWSWKSRRRVGRTPIPPEVRALIREMSEANLLWGAPRIHGELLKLGIDVSQTCDPQNAVRRAFVGFLR
jgi:hypothetical protein